MEIIEIKVKEGKEKINKSEKKPIKKRSAV